MLRIIKLYFKEDSNMETSFYLTEARMKEIRGTITINQEQKDIPDDLHLFNIFITYSAIINYGLQDLNGKFTWREVQYMLASVNSTLFSNDDINFAVSAFIYGLIDFEVYDEEQTGQFDIEAKKLVAKLQKEHPISVFALVSLLRQYWICKNNIFDDAQEYIKQYIQLKA
jgi:hypothetical protein